MVEVNIESNADIVRDELGRIMSRIPEVEEEVAEDLMEMSVQEIRRSARKNFESFSGNMMDEIKMDNVSRVPTDNGSKIVLSMGGDTPRDADYLGWHENAEKGHWVEVSRDNAPLMEWAERRLDDVPKYLFVRPTPFVSPAVQKIARGARQYAADESNPVGELAREAEV